MSYITDMVVLHHEPTPSQAVAKLNAWCREHDARKQEFRPLDTDAAGGNKVFTMEVLACSANYFPYEALEAAFPKMGWTCPATLLRSNNDTDDVDHPTVSYS